MQKTLLIILTLILIMVIFSIQNAVEVNVKFFIWQFNASLPVLLLLSLTIGAYLSFLFSIPGRKKRNKKIDDLEKRVEELKKKLIDKNLTKESEKKKDE